jgi:DNA end-binding protein Ku
MRTTWNGSLSFGLVSIPVGLAPATKPAARQSDISFRLLHRECGTPLRQKRWCPTHDREILADEIVKGWEVTKGEFIMVEDADLEAIQQADTSRSIDIQRFVPIGEVDPVYFDRTYFLAPAAAAAARRPYVLLARAMAETEMAALGRFVLAGKEKLCLIRARGEALVLETLFLAEDVFSQAEIDDAVSEADVKEPELDLARQVIASLTAEFEPGELTSAYRQDLRRMLEAKEAGHEITTPEPEPEAPVVDLMEALRQSVAAAKTRRGAPAGSKDDGATDGKAPKKSAARSRARAKSA